MVAKKKAGRNMLAVRFQGRDVDLSTLTAGRVHGMLVLC